MDMTHEAHQTVSVSWDETIPGVIRYTMEPRWTLADLQRALTVGFEMQRASTFQTVHIVFDTQKTTMVPTGIISVARRIFRQCPSNTDKLIVLTKNSLVRSMTALVNRVLAYEGRQFEVIPDEQSLRQSFR